MVTQGEKRPGVATYVPTDDPDEDGVPNSQDSFPLDPAAAQDSDRDGHPGAWNPGMGPGDSTTGLALDAYPLDSACWLPEHGTGGVCDIAGALPAYDPARVVMGADDVVYLLSPENRRIYRWSISMGAPLNPIVTGPDPTLMAYSAVTHRLYVGYPGGAITQIELASSVVEEPFTVAFWQLSGLATANEFVVVADSTGYQRGPLHDSRRAASGSRGTTGSTLARLRVEPRHRPHVLLSGARAGRHPLGRHRSRHR